MKQFSQPRISSRVPRVFAFLAIILNVTISSAALEEPTCVFKDLASNEVCPAFATARALEVLGIGDETIIFIEQDATKIANKLNRTSVVASSRIEDAVLNEEFDADDAMLLESEVQELSGARYELPKSRKEVKRLLGFPDGADVEAGDWLEMLSVHAELTLSLSANASHFLLEQMGVVGAKASEPEIESEQAAQPVPAEPLAVAIVPSNPIIVETH